MVLNLGSYSYSRAFGCSSLKDGERSNILELDAVYWMASCTKLITAIAALQCVERGHFTLDEDVTRLLPELKEIQVQTNDKAGAEKPALSKAKKIITLRYDHNSSPAI